MSKNERWTPHVTVATIVEQNSRFLLVHEAPDGSPVYNQPAGHLDEGEKLTTAARRETLEETGWDVTITDYLGLYRYIAPNRVTYLRHGFVAKPVKHYPKQSLDTGIIEAVWMTYEEIQKRETEMRSTLVKQLIDDYRSGRFYPLAVLNEDR
ncbi:MAG: NUDIX hydrolase [Cellvibrionaceae bacterium]